MQITINIYTMCGMGQQQSGTLNFYHSCLKEYYLCIMELLNTIDQFCPGGPAYTVFFVNLATRASA